MIGISGTIKNLEVGVFVISMLLGRELLTFTRVRAHTHTHTHTHRVYFTCQGQQHTFTVLLWDVWTAQHLWYNISYRDLLQCAFIGQYAHPLQWLYSSAWACCAGSRNYSKYIVKIHRWWWEINHTKVKWSSSLEKFLGFQLSMMDTEVALSFSYFLIKLNKKYFGHPTWLVGS